MKLKKEEFEILNDLSHSLFDLVYLRRNLKVPTEIVNINGIWDEAERRLALARGLLGKIHTLTDET